MHIITTFVFIKQKLINDWYSKIFNGAKGYGFITNDETSEDIFVHVIRCIRINEGDKVEYSEEDGKKR